MVPVKVHAEDSDQLNVGDLVDVGDIGQAPIVARQIGPSGTGYIFLPEGLLAPPPAEWLYRVAGRDPDTGAVRLVRVVT